MTRLALAIALSLFPLSATAETPVIETFRGPVTLEANPAEVVVFDLAAIDTLSALGVPIAGVPSVTAPGILGPMLEGIPVVGTLFEPDFEALAVMGPDLIVAGARSQEQVEPLGRIAPTIDMTFAREAFVETLRARITGYAALFGREAEGAAVLAGLDADIAAARAAIAGRGAALIVMTNGGSLSAFGPDSRFGWMHSDLGLPQAHEGLAAGRHGESVSFEFIAEVNPDWLLVIDRGAATGRSGEAAAVTLDTPLIAGTTAGRNGRIVYLDSGAAYLSAGGVQSMQHLLRQITEAFAAAPVGN